MQVAYIPLVSREWKHGSNSSYNCTPFIHSLLTKGKVAACILYLSLNPEPSPPPPGEAFSPVNPEP